LLFFPDFQAMKPVSGVPTGFLPLNRATMVAPTFKERVLKSVFFYYQNFFLFYCFHLPRPIKDFPGNMR